MYAKIAYNAAVQSYTTLMEDIRDLFVNGQDDLSMLPNSPATRIDLGASSIDVTTPLTAWEEEAYSAGIELTMKNVVHDDGAQPIYYRMYSYSDEGLRCIAYDTWDTPGTVNQGSGQIANTYQASSSNADCVDWLSLNSANHAALTIHIWATNHSYIIYSQSNNARFAGSLQMQRGEAWDTAANGFIPAIMFGYGASASAFPYSNSFPYQYNTGATENTGYLTGGSNRVYFTTKHGCDQYSDTYPYHLVGSTVSGSKGLDAVGDPVHQMQEFWFVRNGITNRYASGKPYDSMYLATTLNGDIGDIITIDGDTYVIWAASIWRWALKL
jgi:hypothetical protein